MKKNQKISELKVSSKEELNVYFNASVVLSGLRSPHGGSGELLRLVRIKKIKGQISEIVADEIIRHAGKLGLNKKNLGSKLTAIFGGYYPAPQKLIVESFYGVVADVGDAHLLASCQENEATCLVSLDKKHILCLKGKIKNLRIVSPAELIQSLK